MTNIKSITTTFFFTVALAICIPKTINAQTLKLSVNDTMNIDAAVKEQLNNLQENLNTLSDPSLEPAEKETIINNMVEPSDNIFSNAQVFVENDLDPSLHTPGGPSLQSKEYLHNFCLFFVQKQSSPVVFEITEISAVKVPKGGNTMYVKVVFNETLNGTDKSGKPHTAKKHRAATFTVSKSDKWKAYINNLGFDGGSADQGEFVEVTGGNQVEIADVTIKSESYYIYLLAKGNNALKDNNYAESYLAFREATFSKATEKDARIKIEELKNKMKNNGIYEINTEWNKGLIAKAHNFEKVHKYEEAHRCYQYAYELVNTDKTLPSIIQTLSDKLDVQNKLEGLFRNKQYDEAIKGYTAALTSDGQNPFLYVGRAKCYATKGKESDARLDFEKAISLDNTNLEAFKWKGYFMEQLKSPNYTEAAKSFALYLNNFEDKADPSLEGIYAEMTFVNGMIAFKKGSYSEALDTFKRAASKIPNFEKAILYQGVCYYYRKESEKALERIDTVLTLNNKNAEAHYWKGKIIGQNSSKESQDKYIAELTNALSYDNMNCAWNYELGYTLQNNGRNKDAVTYFKNCIDSKGPQSNSALWSRGQCYYKLGNYSEAAEDYTAFAKPGVTLQPKFYSDLGFLCLMQGDAAKAIENFNKANNSPEACYGLGEAYFLADANNSSKFMEEFENAFRKGLSQDLINADPFLDTHATLANDKDFKNLRKKYKK